MCKFTRNWGEFPLMPIKLRCVAGDIVGYQGDSGNLQDAIEDGYAESHTHIKAKERTGRGWNLENDYTTINPEELLATKFDEDGNSTPPMHQ